MTIWSGQNKFVKVWKDNEDLKAGFFNSDNTLLKEVAIQNLNHSEPEEIAKEMAEAHNIRVQSGNGVEFDLFQGNYQAIEHQTTLSTREAELYVLTEELGYSIVQASDKMNISKNNAYGKRGKIKEKIQKAKETAKLEL